MLGVFNLCFCVSVCFRPVCPSGDGGVLESCCSSSHLDPLPYSIWPFISSASLEGEPFMLFFVFFSYARGLTSPTALCSAALMNQFIATRSFSLLLSRGFAVTLLYGKINSEKHLEKCEHSYLPPTQIGILKVNTHMHTQFDLAYTNKRIALRINFVSKVGLVVTMEIIKVCFTPLLSSLDVG